MREKLMDMVDEGIIDPNDLIRDLLNWMTREDVSEFARANGYIDEDEDEDEDEDDWSCPTCGLENPTTSCGLPNCGLIGDTSLD